MLNINLYVLEDHDQGQNPKGSKNKCMREAGAWLDSSWAITLMNEKILHTFYTILGVSVMARALIEWNIFCAVISKDPIVMLR